MGGGCVSDSCAQRRLATAGACYGKHHAAQARRQTCDATVRLSTVGTTGGPPYRGCRCCSTRWLGMPRQRTTTSDRFWSCATNYQHCDSTTTRNVAHMYNPDITAHSHSYTFTIIYTQRKAHDSMGADPMVNDKSTRTQQQLQPGPNDNPHGPIESPPVQLPVSIQPAGDDAPTAAVLPAIEPVARGTALAQWATTLRCCPGGASARRDAPHPPTPPPQQPL